MRKTWIAVAVLTALCLMTGCSGSTDSGTDGSITETAETTELTGGETTELTGDQTGGTADEDGGNEEGEEDEPAEDDGEQDDNGGSDETPDDGDDGQQSGEGIRPADPDETPVTAPADPTKLQLSTGTQGGKDGFFYCDKLDEGVEVTADSDVSDAYIEKCADAVKNMPQTTLIAIWEGAKKTCLAFIEQEKEMLGDSFETARTSPKITADTPSKEMAQYIRLGEMQIEKPSDEKVIGYELSGSCEWDLEGGFEVVIVNDRVIYAGDYRQYSPWDTEYYTKGEGKEQNYAQ